MRIQTNAALALCAAFALLTLPPFAMAQDAAKPKKKKKNANVTRVFNGKNLDNWKTREDKKGENKWTIGVPSIKSEDQKTLDVAQSGKGRAMINNVSDHGQSWDIYSNEKFGDCVINLDVMVPKGANSGIYVMGEYEIQVLDSYGKEEIGSGDMGAIYGAGAAAVNASKKPGEWQHYTIRWQAPKFDDAGNKTQNAKFLQVKLNGKVLHKNVEMEKPTPGGVTGKEAATGPIMFQGNHGPVAYKNIRIKPLPAAKKKA